MSQTKFEEALTRTRFLPIIRVGSVNEAVDLGHRLQDAGINLLEVSWTTPGAAEAVRRLSDGQATIGAGTVLDAAMAQAAYEAGATFLVAPNFSPEVLAFARPRGLPYLAGAMTPTEVYRVYAAGISTIKLFPASSGGISHLKAMQEVYPGVRFVPTGGISPIDAPNWIQAGALAVGMGGALTRSSTSELRETLRILRRNLGMEEGR